MAKTTTQTWPRQIIEGGWRKVGVPLDYFCKYFRWHKGQRQIIFLDHQIQAWCLLIQTRRVSIKIPCDSLNLALRLADDTRQVREANRPAGA